MRKTITIMLTGAMLAAPAASIAAEVPSGTICDSRGSGDCYTIESTDTMTTRSVLVDTDAGQWHPATNTYSYWFDNCMYRWDSMDQWRSGGSTMSSNHCVVVGFTAVTYTFRKFRFPDIPAEDRERLSPDTQLEVNQWHVGPLVIPRGDYVHKFRTTTDNTSLCMYYASNGEWNGNNERTVAEDRTPDSVMQACGYTRRASDPAPPTQTPPAPTSGIYSTQPVGQVASLPIPRQSASCGKVRGKGRTVAVRSLGASCKGSRLIVARYARALKQPKGWRCHVASKQQRVRCIRTTGARAKAKRMIVYGQYISRS